MDGVYLTAKRIGESMGQLVERFAGEFGIDVKVVPITFAGRLDPLAEGLCILLVGSFVHEKEKYLAYDKTYTGTFVTGISTDTYDIAGMPKLRTSLMSKERVLQEIQNWKTYNEQSYPMFSSKPVDGKPLWMWARDGKVPPGGVPSRAISVSGGDGEYIESISLDEFRDEVKNLLAIFPSGFRQDEIMKDWEGIERDMHFDIYQFSVTVSSGTYIRGLVHMLGERSGGAAVLKTLVRTRIGPFHLSRELRAGKASKIDI